MTNGELKKFEDWQREITEELRNLSGRVGDIQKTMVTREEYNKAHAPLVAMVERHDKLYQWGVRSWNKLAWFALITILGSVWAAPHAQAIVRGVDDVLKLLAK